MSIENAGLVKLVRSSVAEYVAARYQRETRFCDDGVGHIFITVAGDRMTDSFKLVFAYKGGSGLGFHIEVADKVDVSPSHDFFLPTLESAVDAYMALFTFFKERVLSRCSDI